MFARRTASLLVVLAFGLGLPFAAKAQEAVLSGVAVRVNPGQLDAYLGRVKQLQQAMQRVGASGQVEAWQVTAGGQAAGTTLVVIEYPNLVAYAEGTTKTQGDAEFAKLIGGLDALRTIQSSSLYRQLSGPGREGNLAAGTILQSVSVRVKPGRLDDYLAKLDQLRKISERLGTSNKIRVWQATAAGQGTGTVVVGVLHEDLATYAADSTKLQSDAEWAKLIGGLDDIRTIVSTALLRNVGP